MSFSDQLARLRPIAQQHATSLPTPYPRYVLFFSVTDGQDRAQVVHARAASFEAAWQEGVEAIRKVLRKHKLSGDWLRVDWVEAAETLPWEVLHSRLAATKRNYFRHGLALSADFTLAFLEQELNANAMLYAGSDVAQARINPKNFNVYAASRFGVEIDFDHPVKDPVVFTTGAAYCERTGPAYRLASSGLEAGRRLTGRLAEKDVLALVNTGGSFLARQVKRSGEFVYGYFPCFNREIPTYNALRHASSTYALIEAWEATGDRSLRPAIERALGYLTRELIRRTHAPDGTELAFLVEKNDEIKLGGNAVSLLALVKYCEVSGDKTHLPLLESLAQGIAFMQEPKSGRLNHVLHFPDLSVKEDFRIIYYDGEAAFGLMRLYGLTRDARWLSVVEKAFDYFIARKHWTAHDHWLSYCVNELTRYCDDEKYYRFGLQNVSGYLDFVLERETTFPTLLELMMAAQQMLERLQQQPDKRHLLALIDLDKFYHALEHRAHYLQNGYFWPEMAMFFKKPARIVGSFFIRHHAFRVRIDDVEHYLSGLVAYLRYCRAGRPVVEAPAVAAPALAATWQGGDNWNAERVTQATGGQWLSPPPLRLERHWPVCVGTRHAAGQHGAHQAPRWITWRAGGHCAPHAAAPGGTDHRRAAADPPRSRADTGGGRCRPGDHRPWPLCAQSDEGHADRRDGQQWQDHHRGHAHAHPGSLGRGRTDPTQRQPPARYRLEPGLDAMGRTLHRNGNGHRTHGGKHPAGASQHGGIHQYRAGASGISRHDGGGGPQEERHLRRHASGRTGHP